MTDDKKTYKVTSFNQMGGITAGQVNIGALPRQLDTTGRGQLRSNIPKDKKVTVVAVMGDGEAFQYAKQIRDFLQDDGYDVSGVDQAVYSEPVVGQGIVQKGDRYEVVIGTRQ